MLINLRPGELEKLIPAVATSEQFSSALGNPRKILQRIMISVIGGLLTFFIWGSQQGNSQFSPIWLISCVIFFTHLLWGPILEAGRKNSELRRHQFSALFEGEVADVFTKEKIENRHEQANKRGELELVENRRTWMVLELEDEEGYLGQIKFPMEKRHQLIRKGLSIRCLILSDRRDFSNINALSDAWLPSPKIWVGEYPYLLRPAFEEFCRLRLNPIPHSRSFYY